MLTIDMVERQNSKHFVVQIEGAEKIPDDLEY